MAMPNKKGWLAIFFILLCLAIPFGITYYVSTDGFKDKYAKWRGPLPVPPENATLEKSRTIDDQVILVKGERIRIHNTSLVYKGINHGRVSIDLFLKELDPDHAYAQVLPEDLDHDQVVRLGDVAYQIKAVSAKTLVLTIYQTMGTR
ncbi:MAG: hypothetical protein HUK40_19960 [Desulfobacter sp.]|nr:hypothetical protein [Desulfobacter sp.]WDP86499.1 MAG: hypothetical protein HUN05_16360 [Desulfobacter sp.]